MEKFENGLQKQSEQLVKQYERAQTRNDAVKIAKLEEELWEVWQEKQKALVLAHKVDVRIFASREDRLRGEISLIGRDRTNAKGDSLAGYNKFHNPFKNQAFSRIGTLYTDLSRQMVLKQIGSPKFDALQRPIFRVVSALPALLEALKVLSSIAQEIREAIVPLGTLQKMLDRAEDEARKSFPVTEFFLNDQEQIELRQFCPSQNQIADTEWRADVLLPDVIERNLKCVLFFTKPRVQVAA
jgi:hypothetical protein